MGSEGLRFLHPSDNDPNHPSLHPEQDPARVQENRERANRETLDYLGGRALSAAEIENISKRAGW